MLVVFHIGSRDLDVLLQLLLGPSIPHSFNNFLLAPGILALQGEEPQVLLRESLKQASAAVNKVTVDDAGRTVESCSLGQAEGAGQSVAHSKCAALRGDLVLSEWLWLLQKGQCMS